MTRVRCDRPVANSRSYLHPSCLITSPHSPVCAKSRMKAPRSPGLESGSVFAGTHALATQAAWSLGNFRPVSASAVPLIASDATRAAATPNRLTTVPPFGYGVPAAVLPIENTSSRARLVFWRVTPKAARAPYLVASAPRHGPVPIDVGGRLVPDLLLSNHASAADQAAQFCIRTRPSRPLTTSSPPPVLASCFVQRARPRAASVRLRITADLPSAARLRADRHSRHVASS